MAVAGGSSYSDSSPCAKASSFDPAELRSGKLTVYLILPPNHMRAQSALLRMWISSQLRAVVAGGLQERRLTHWILDEAASLGHLESLEDAIDKYRGYGVRLQFYFQSMGQLKKCFPDGGDQTLLTNTTQVFMGVNDQGLPGGAGTGDYVSARLGDQTVVVDSGGTSTGRSSQSSSGGGGSGSKSVGHSSNGSANWAQQVRRLLQPSEVVGLHLRVAVTFTPGVPPIWTWTTRYYEEAQPTAKPGAYRRTLAAVNTLTVAVAVFAAAALLAVRATERAGQTRPRRPAAPEWHFDSHTFQGGRPDVPVGQ